MSSRHLSDRINWPIAAVAGLNAVAAAGGAIGLITGYLDLSPEVTSRLPAGSAPVGGLALGLFVAVPNAVLASLALRADRRTGAAAMAAGAVLVGWIVVQVAFIRELSFFHPFYLGIGLLLVWLGHRARRMLSVAPGREVPVSWRERVPPRA